MMPGACDSALGEIPAQHLVSQKRFSLEWMLSKAKVLVSGV
jgi:hypothetical protein